MTKLKAGKNKRGRPLTVATPQDFVRLTDEYLARCVADEKPITLTGAIRHLGLSGRPALDGYLEREGFSEPVKRLKLAVEQAYEERLHGPNPTGAIFALKNMGWSDRRELEHSGEVKTQAPALVVNVTSAA